MIPRDVRPLYNNEGYVWLVDVMPGEFLSQDKAVVDAAITTTFADNKRMMGKYTDTTVQQRLINILIQNKHMSPFEFVEFKWKAKLPIMVIVHLLRYRTFSFAQQSGRKTTFGIEDFFTPNFKNKDSLEVFEDILDRSIEAYEALIEAEERREIARTVLPYYASLGVIMFKSNARNLMHFLEERLAPSAQKETVEFAQGIYNLWQNVMPLTARAFLEIVLKKE